MHIYLQDGIDRPEQALEQASLLQELAGPAFSCLTQVRISILSASMSQVVDVATNVTKLASCFADRRSAMQLLKSKRSAKPSMQRIRTETKRNPCTEEWPRQNVIGARSFRQAPNVTCFPFTARPIRLPLARFARPPDLVADIRLQTPQVCWYEQSERFPPSTVFALTKV